LGGNVRNIVFLQGRHGNATIGGVLSFIMKKGWRSHEISIDAAVEFAKGADGPNHQTAMKWAFPFFGVQ
jgi:hypothetical protein